MMWTSTKTSDSYIREIVQILLSQSEIFHKFHDQSFMIMFHDYDRDHSFITFAKKKCFCAYKEVRDFSFSENFAKVINESHRARYWISS